MLNLTQVDVQMHPLALVHRPKVCAINSNAFFSPLTINWNSQHLTLKQNHVWLPLMPLTTGEPWKGSVRDGGVLRGWGSRSKRAIGSSHLYTPQQVSREDGPCDRWDPAAAQTQLLETLQSQQSFHSLICRHNHNNPCLTRVCRH